MHPGSSLGTGCLVWAGQHTACGILSLGKQDFPQRYSRGNLHPKWHPIPSLFGAQILTRAHMVLVKSSGLGIRVTSHTLWFVYPVILTSRYKR